MGRETRNISVVECSSRNIEHGKSLPTITFPFLLPESITMKTAEISTIDTYMIKYNKIAKQL